MWRGDGVRLVRSRNLPADLIKEWAAKHARDNAKLEGRELPQGYVRPPYVQEYLERAVRRHNMRPVHNANGEIVSLIPDD